MKDSFIFKGTSFVLGNYEILNDEIEKYVKSHYLEGFDYHRIENSEDYQEFIKKQSKTSAFDYMVGNIMGFYKRFHVVSFPPTTHKYEEAENSLDLCVNAIEKLLEKTKLNGNEIDAWFVSSATQTQFAPGIAEIAKSYFADIDNQAPCYSLTSACVGFNINLENAIMYFKQNPQAKNILIAHTEVMSALLPNTKDFVPFSSFGDSAAAVILSRVKTENQEGVVYITNSEDTKMLDFLGADPNGKLFMNPRMVKSRAVPNISNTFNKILKETQWKIEDLKYFIPHQTGNAIVDSVAKKIGIEKNKVYKEIQYNYGNLSGASIPACLDLLLENELKVGDKIITSVAGLGGEFGGFAYIVPQNNTENHSQAELENKTIFITGASGGIGREIAMQAAEKGGNLILHYNSNSEKITKIKNDILSKYKVKIDLVQADLSDKNQTENLVYEIKSKFKNINYLIVTHAITGSLSKASEVSDLEFEKVLDVNYFSIKNLCDICSEIVTESIVIMGSVGEDAQFPGSASYVASKRALRAYAVSLATKVYENKVNCVYYLPGIVEAGMMAKLDKSQINMSLNNIRQKSMIEVKKIAERILKSAYRMKIPKVRISYESHLKVIKDGYLKY